MQLDFSPFEIYIIAGIKFWYISLPLGLLLAGVAIFAKNQGTWLRVSSIAGALFLLIPFIGYGLFLLKIEMKQRDLRQQREANSWVLKEPATVAGIEVPADTKIFFNTWFDMSQKRKASPTDIQTFNFSEPTEVFGIVVSGRFSKTSYYWEGSLHGHQMIDGWPCTGEIAITDKGELIECTLFRDHEIFGHRLPEGTEIELKPWSWTCRFPKGKIISFDPNTEKLTFSSDSSAAFNFK